MIIQTYKVCNNYIEFVAEQSEDTKITEKRITSFPKE